MMSKEGIQMGKDVFIHSSAIIGKHVSIYDGVTIGPNSTIGDFCTIGEPLAAYYSNEGYVQPPTFIGSNALIRSHSIIYAGNHIGDHFSTGHRVTIRENNTIGNHVSFGTLSDIQGESIFGNYVRLHSSVHICQCSFLGDFVMVYPFVVFMNDRFPPSMKPNGPKVGAYTQIGVQAIIHSGVAIGDNSFVGSQSSVNKNLPSFSFFVGNPGKIIGDVREMKDSEGQPLYPWPHRFDRGMPWQGQDYKTWEKEN
jgi:acetyltransferase-like isoleucine patch superfamily enzyme